MTAPSPVSEFIEVTERGVSEIIGMLTNSAFPSPMRQRIVMALCQLVIDDARAIVKLVRDGVTASARSLVRVQFESLVRAAWVMVVAADRDVQAISDAKDGAFPNLAPASVQIAEHGGFSICGYAIDLEALRKRATKAMNDFTHRGTQAIARRIDANALHDHEDEADAGFLLAFAGLNASVAGAAILEMIGRIDEAKALCPALETLYRKAAALPSAQKSDGLVALKTVQARK